MKALDCFKKCESGAVTVDWVVLTSAIVGIAISVIILISGGVREASYNILGGINTDWNFDFSTKNAESYFDFGIEAFPNDQHSAWLSARLEVDADAPDGYEYDPDMTKTRNVDNSSGHPIYVSDNGTTFSIDGEVIAATDYDSSGSTSFKSTFDQYWEQSQPQP